MPLLYAKTGEQCTRVRYNEAVNDLPARILARVVSLRAPILVVYALLVPLAALRAARIPSEGGLDRLIQPSDPDYVATRDFQRIFPDRPSVMLFFESDDPWAPANLSRVESAVRELRKEPHLGAFSVLDALRKVRPGASPSELRRLATGTQFFRKQGLLGDRFLSVVVDIDVHNPAERDAALASTDAALARAGAEPVRRVGAPYVQSWLEHESGAASVRYFPFFGALVVGTALLLYRSVRTLLAFVLALGSAVALGVAVGGLLGFTFTVVSVLVPLTVLVTTLATLVYLHSRFVDRPAGISLRDHQLVALRNKLLPVTASTVAAVMGFAALSVSKLRPIQELGIWTALGLAISWLVAFTLFPALQLMLRTPTGTARVAGGMPTRRSLRSPAGIAAASSPPRSCSALPARRPCSEFPGSCPRCRSASIRSPTSIRRSRCAATWCGSARTWPISTSRTSGSTCRVPQRRIRKSSARSTGSRARSSPSLR